MITVLGTLRTYRLEELLLDLECCISEFYINNTVICLPPVFTTNLVITLFG